MNPTPYSPASHKPGTSALEKAVEYFHKVVQLRLNYSIRPHVNHEPLPEFSVPNDGSEFAKFLLKQKLERNELIVLMTALLPHIDPGFYWRLIAEYFPNGGEFPEFGGVKGTNHRGILPTGETALFIAAGNEMQQRFDVQKILSGDHFMVRDRIVWLDDAPAGDPAISGRLLMATEQVSLFTLGYEPSPQFSTQFPAQRIDTNLTWDDLILPGNVKQQLDEIQTWVEQEENLRNAWGMHKRMKPGYRVLFYGPPGTGKTLTASLLGRHAKKNGEQFEREVYKVDLSMVVSKYIGETEKNLANLFARAENKKWILFFDEADALFGKRTDVRDAHDKYANQEVSYLLQRIEEYNGLIILASNMKSNMDEAFLRRFNTIIKFPPPDEIERLQIWKNAFPTQIALRDSDTFFNKAAKYNLTGGNIINIVHYVCLKIASAKTDFLETDALLEGIKREYAKEGKIFQM
ncbi:ATP-binding protein [Spirosoma panaciterrae]|uniref:ATP-binding protein n=1 Tax=Spirosoma panaciterrae TaxID=496058 RepID=UPI000365700F|nr:ATP-binding protein [Spirosoma panaciterrae]